MHVTPSFVSSFCRIYSNLHATDNCEFEFKRVFRIHEYNVLIIHHHK
jgi:hypothetical protein